MCWLLSPSVATRAVGSHLIGAGLQTWSCRPRLQGLSCARDWVAAQGHPLPLPKAGHWDPMQSRAWLGLGETRGRGWREREREPVNYSVINYQQTKRPTARALVLGSCERLFGSPVLACLLGISGPACKLS